MLYLLYFPLAVSSVSDTFCNLDRRAGSSMSGYRKDEYNWRYDSDELSDDVIRASAALENLQLDRKARNLTTSWRFVFQHPLNQNFLSGFVYIKKR